jgi:hypothetical protein
MQETLLDNNYSKLDSHEKVNPFLTDDDALYKLLSSKFPANIKKTEAFPEAAPIIVTEQDPTTEASNTVEDIDFEEVPDENKELPNSQLLLEEGTPENTESSEEETKTDDISGFTKGEKVKIKNPQREDEKGSFYVQSWGFAPGYVMIGESPESSSSIEVKAEDLSRVEEGELPETGSLFTPDDLPSIDPENQVEGTCE